MHQGIPAAEQKTGIVGAVADFVQLVAPDRVETEAPIGAQIVTEGASKLREGSQVATAETGRGPRT